MAHVQAIGRKLSPAFCVEVCEESKGVALRYDGGEFEVMMQRVSSGDGGSLSTSLLPVQPPRQLAWGNLQDFLHMVQAPPQDGGWYEWVVDDGDDDEVEEEEVDMDGDDEIDPAFLI